MERRLITDVFDIFATKQDDRINFSDAEVNDLDAMPFVSRTAKNNGITSYCLSRPDKINSGRVITLALDGSTGSTFYQHHDFLSGQNIWVLQPREAFTGTLMPTVMMFLVTTVRKAVEAYTYNLSLTKTRLKNIQIMVPVTASDTLDTIEIEKVMRHLRHGELLKKIPDERYQILT